MHSFSKTNTGFHAVYIYSIIKGLKRLHFLYSTSPLVASHIDVPASACFVKIYRIEQLKVRSCTRKRKKIRTFFALDSCMDSKLQHMHAWLVVHVRMYTAGHTHIHGFMALQYILLDKQVAVHPYSVVSKRTLVLQSHARRPYLAAILTLWRRSLLISFLLF
jgi:hypothetical protein